MIVSISLEDLAGLVEIRELEKEYKRLRLILILLTSIAWILSSTILAMIFLDLFTIGKKNKAVFTIFISVNAMVVLNITYIVYYIYNHAKYKWVVSAHIFSYVTCHIISAAVILSSADHFYYYWGFVILEPLLFILLFFLNFSIFQMFETTSRKEQLSVQMWNERSKLVAIGYQKPIYISLHGYGSNDEASSSGLSRARASLVK